MIWVAELTEPLPEYQAKKVEERFRALYGISYQFSMMRNHNEEYTVIARPSWKSEVPSDTRERLMLQAIMTDLVLHRVGQPLGCAEAIDYLLESHDILDEHRKSVTAAIEAALDEHA
jgi:hypothetical protein